METRNIKGKIALIIGGTSGIGLVTAQLLINEGARVMVTGSSKASTDSAHETLGQNVIVVKSDTSSLTDIDALATRVKSEFGKLDALFIAAGITRFVPFEHMTEDVYDQLLAVNTKGAYFTVQKLAPLISEGGSITMVTSVVHEKGIPMISAYSASKGALRSLTRAFARELLSKGIRVNAVSPGPIDSGILEKTMSKEAAAQIKQQMSEEIPMKRVGNPVEVATALLFLAFEATYTTGAELAVDGGGTQL